MREQARLQLVVEVALVLIRNGSGIVFGEKRRLLG
jgi:hypothetical protein